MEDKAWLAKFWENTNLIDINGKMRIMVIVPYKNPVEKTFPASENNYSQAVGAARGIVRKLHNKKDGSLEEYCKQIEKDKKQGTLVKLSLGAVERLKGRPHHYTLHGIVYKPDSISTSVRLVNKTSVIAKAETTTLSIKCPAVAKFINKLSDTFLTL